MPAPIQGTGRNTRYAAKRVGAIPGTGGNTVVIQIRRDIGSGGDSGIGLLVVESPSCFSPVGFVKIVDPDFNLRRRRRLHIILKAAPVSYGLSKRKKRFPVGLTIE